MKNRYHLLDALRGLALVNMIAFHGMWDLVYLRGVNAPWYESFGAFCWQQGICWTFILLSGYCWAMSRSHVKQGLTVFLAGAVVSAVTAFMGPDTIILFGVLTLLGSAALITILVDIVFKKLPPWLGLVLSAALFALTRWTVRGYWGIQGIFTLPLPGGLYHNMLTAYVGFPQPSFYSTDYFPLIPWLFLFWCGYFLYRLTEKHLPESELLRVKLPLLSLMGRHSLLIYLAHQPVLYLLTQLF